MKIPTLLSLVLIVVLCPKLHAQIKFEDGYFISESNQKVECLIKNIDWRNNPTNFEYKLSHTDTVLESSIETVREFGINKVSKYVRAKINIDRSSERAVQLSTQREPQFHEEVLFLKVLVEGEASLYGYVDGNLNRFFYQLDDGDIKQLVYKSYLDGIKILKNEYFKQQLFVNMKCDEMELKYFNDLRYYLRDLERLFVKFNECSSSKYVNYVPKQNKDLLNLTIRSGITFGSLAIQNSSSSSRDTDFGNTIGARIGVEAEFIMPFNKNKWSIITEPSYQFLKSEQSREIINVSGEILVSKIEYKLIEVPLGLRHNFYLNDISKLFLNISYGIAFPVNSSIIFLSDENTIDSELDFAPRTNWSFGIGYNYKDNCSLEIRSYANQNVLSNYKYWNSDYRIVSIVFGYSIF